MRSPHTLHTSVRLRAGIRSVCMPLVDIEADMLAAQYSCVDTAGLVVFESVTGLLV